MPTFQLFTLSPAAKHFFISKKPNGQFKKSTVFKNRNKTKHISNILKMHLGGKGALKNTSVKSLKKSGQIINP